MKQIKFMDLKAQNAKIRNELITVFDEVLDSGNYVSGNYVQSFESDFAAAHSVKHAIACNSGTSALELILRSLEIGPGDEVIVPAMTFVATMEAIVQVGATPVIVDVDPNTWNLSPIGVSEVISPSTRAVIFVHLHGSSAGIEEVKLICDSEKIPLIEDAAQAHLASSNGTLVGNFGVAAAFSFYPGKNLGALGEGGAITTNSLDIAGKCVLIRNWGSREKYNHEIRGGNFRMDEIQAAFLQVKLRHLGKWTATKRKHAPKYDNFFDSLEVQRPFSSGIEHSYHIYAILLANREEIATQLSKVGIATGIHYPHSLDQLLPWKKFSKVPQEIKVAKELSRKFLSIPLHENLDSQDVEEILVEIAKLI